MSPAPICKIRRNFWPSSLASRYTSLSPCVEDTADPAAGAASTSVTAWIVTGFSNVYRIHAACPTGAEGRSTLFT